MSKVTAAALRVSFVASFLHRPALGANSGVGGGWVVGTRTKGQVTEVLYQHFWGGRVTRRCVFLRSFFWSHLGRLRIQDWVEFLWWLHGSTVTIWIIGSDSEGDAQGLKLVQVGLERIPVWAVEPRLPTSGNSRVLFNSLTVFHWVGFTHPYFGHLGYSQRLVRSNKSVPNDFVHTFLNTHVSFL